MNRNSFGIRVVCSMVALAAAGVPAAAQSQSPPPSANPFAGLFRGSPRDQPHTLDVRASGFAAWDDNLLAQTPTSGGGIGSGVSAVDPRFIKQGVASGFQGSLTYGYRKTGTRSSFNVGGDASVQQFASGLGDPLWFKSYNVSTGLRTSVTTKTSISFGAATAYAPFYQYAPFLKSTTSEESPVGSDYGFAVNSTMVRSTSASVSVQNQFSKRSGISAGIGWAQQVTPGNNAASLTDPIITTVSDEASIDSRTAQATFSHNLTRKLAFHVGYGIQESRYPSRPEIEPVRTHAMDIGLGYGDGLTLSLGRRTTLSLSIGTSIAKNGDPVLVASTGKATAFMVTGGATLARSIGRSWGASVGYSRGTSYVVGFKEPLMTDGANAGISGPLFTRLQFSAGAGASRGQQLFSSGGNVISYTASTRLTYGLFGNLGLYSQASYSRFTIPPGFADIGFVPDLDRRSVSVGLTAWLPLIKQRRAPRDSGTQTTTGQP
jgi:hypothetical protein